MNGAAVTDATTTAKGIMQLAGDLAGTATSPTVAKIQSKAVSSTAPTNGQILKYNTTTSAWEPAADIDTNTTYTAGSGMTLTGTSFSANDATTTSKGIVQLAGDLAGTAASPSIATGAVTSTKIADGTVANADLASGTGGIYNGNGNLSGNTTVTQGDKTLAFTSTASSGTSHFTVDGTTLNVDAVNNRVGIGTSSPSTKLDINSSTSGAVKIVDGTQGTSKVLTSDANGVATWSFSGVRTVRVAATGARNTSGTYSLTSGGVIVYTIENLDVDNAYNSTTGVFTAPRDGYYTFEVATYLSSSNTTATNAYVDLEWSANTLGSYELGRVWEGSSTAAGAWFLKQGTNTMFLAAGQTIKIVFFQGGTSPRIDTSISSWPNTFGLNRLVITY
ncbi:hypothetical protein [Chryseobacterium sp. POE27]|uniref:hypothetical protein n=1 Tax=Chryseobacterium sp. POE27 TaxID=3138177 RepID=UPI003219582E